MADMTTARAAALDAETDPSTNTSQRGRWRSRAVSRLLDPSPVVALVVGGVAALVALAMSGSAGRAVLVLVAILAAPTLVYAHGFRRWDRSAALTMGGTAALSVVVIAATVTQQTRVVTQALAGGAGLLAVVGITAGIWLLSKLRRPARRTTAVTTTATSPAVSQPRVTVQAAPRARHTREPEPARSGTAPIAPRRRHLFDDRVDIAAALAPYVRTTTAYRPLQRTLVEQGAAGGSLASFGARPLATVGEADG